MEKGTLYCVSVGPGDPELMTLKSVRIIKECPVAAISVDMSRRDKEAVEQEGMGGGTALSPETQEALRSRCVAFQIAAASVPELSGKHCLFLSMPMTKDKDLLKDCHSAAARQIEACLKNGRSVAWLTLGDATVYASSMYGALLVKEHGYDVEIVNGVPSFCAASARLGEPLAVGSEQIHILPSSYCIEDALMYPGTKVLMKAGGRMGQVKDLLSQKGLEAKGVQRCGMEGETVYMSAEELDPEAGYYTVLIVK